MLILRRERPLLFNLNPSTGPVGSAVVLTGLFFGPAQENSTLLINGIPAAVVSWASTSITFLIPSTTTGNVILTRGGISSNPLPLTITASGSDPVSSVRLPVGGTWEGLVGVQGGIPNRTTIFTTIAAFTGAPTTINTAITNCPSGQVVQLGPGNFNINQIGGQGVIIITKSGVTLRGSVDANGVPTTKVIFTGTNSQVQLGNFGWDTANAAIYTINGVSSGATRGSSTLTLPAPPANLTVGRMMFILASSNPPSVDGGGFSVFLNDPFSHGCVCTGISGNQVSFSPPLNADYLSGSTIRLIYRGPTDQVEMSGYENIDFSCGTADNPRSAVAPTAYFRIFGTLNCWVKNCRTYWAGGGGNQHYMPYTSVRLEIRHCEIERNQNLSSNSYAIQPQQCSSMLVEDNYIHSIPNMIPFAGGGLNAVTYNYLVDEPYIDSIWLSQIIFTHTSHCHYNLFEGNKVPAYYCDATSSGQFSHSHSLTWFRDRIVGWDANPTQGVTKTNNCAVISFETHHDNATVAGSVMGKPGFHTTYNYTVFDGSHASGIWNLDSTSAATLQRLGNYNAVDNGIRPAEQLSVGQALVSSYRYASKPSWWGLTQPWPWVDPTNFTQSDNIDNFPAGYRVNHGADPIGTAVPTQVQHKAISNSDSVGLWVGTLSNGGTLPIRLPNGTQAGNCIILALTTGTATVPSLSITDNQGNAWARVGAGIADGASGQSMMIYRALNVAANTTIINIQNTSGAGIDTFQAVATEFNNIISVSADDGNSSGNATSAIATCGTLTTSTPSDLIYMAVFRPGASPSTTWTPGTGWNLLSADHQDGMAAQWTQLPGTGGLVPTMTMSTSSKYLAVAVAMKTGSAGSPRPATIRIAGVHHLSQPRGIPNPYVAQVPNLGNLLVLTFSSGDQTYRITGVTDNKGGTWVSTGAFNSSATQDTSQHYYLENASPAQDRTVTITYNTVPSTNDATVIFYDIAGARPTGAFDKRSVATGKMVSTGEFPLSAPGALTPASSSALIIANIQYQFNTANGATSSPSGAIFDAINYTGENNDGPQNMDQNGGWVHYNTTNLNPVTFTWSFTTSQILDTWTAYASCYLGP